MYYEYIMEGVHCIGKQNVCRMFNGKSQRGSEGVISCGTLDKWIGTFEYVKNNPDKKDNDPYQASKINPTQEWYTYVNIIKTPIKPVIYNNWESTVDFISKQIELKDIK